jgi:hypothetical protein
MFRLSPAEFEELKDGTGRLVSNAGSRPKFDKDDNKYKKQIELIFLVLKQDVVREYKFHPTRKWRFDYALPDLKVAVEYQGLNFGHGGPSGHQTIKGIAAENEKLSEAAIAGWCVVLVDAISVKIGLAHSLIKKAIESRE